MMFEKMLCTSPTRLNRFLTLCSIMPGNAQDQVMQAPMWLPAVQTNMPRPSKQVRPAGYLPVPKVTTALVIPDRNS